VRVVTEDEVGTAPSAPAEASGGDLPSSPEIEAAPQRLPASDFSLPDRTGRTISLRELRGRPVLIDFWATWCGPCRTTMPGIERLHRKYGARLHVVGINLEGRAPEVLDYLDQGGYSFLVLFDSGNFQATTASRYGVKSIPRTFLLDREGRILFSGHPQGLDEEEIQAALSE
jgi:thiol-disulfide isomerase/thioredoxin